MGQTHATKKKDDSPDEGPLFAPETDPEVTTIGMSGGTVVRRNINSMSRRDTDRFVRALRRMMDNGSYFELGGIHGWPTNSMGGQFGYCEHRVERFVCWHRVYLAQFERALQAADRQNGQSGNIGLPYWDWTNSPRVPSMMNAFPTVPARAIPSRYRGGQGLPPNKRSRYFTRDGGIDLRHSSNASVRDRDTRDVYRLSFFPNFATKQRSSPGGFRDIESIHDEVHVDCGGIMADLDLAAYSPLFWLHHCHIDRMFETYLKYEPDSSREMDRWEYGSTLRPWGASTNRTFRAIGYRYDRLAEDHVPSSVSNDSRVNMIMMNPQAQAYNPMNQTMTHLGEDPQYHTNPSRVEANTNVVFQVDVRKLTDNSFDVYVFGVPFGQGMDVNINQPERWAQSRWLLATSGILFSRAVAKCENCQKNHSFEMHVPIQKGLKRLGLNRNQVKIQIFFKGNYGGTYTHQQMYSTGKLGGHSVSGPFFGNGTDIKYGDRNNDVAQLQRYLFKYGWYDGKIDEVYSDKTRQACMNFQKFYGMKQDAVCGNVTKNFIINRFRIDDEPDNNGDKRRFFKKVVTYKVMSSPAYLDRNKLLIEVDRAFDQWEECTGVRFDRVQPNMPADIEVRFQSHFKYDILYSTGTGGLLSRSDAKTIILNGQEKWMLMDSRIPRLGGFYMYNVMLHQVGKLIGLSNSGDREDVMYPYYNATKTTLSQDDANAAYQLYHKNNPLQRPHPRQNSDPSIERHDIFPCNADNYNKNRVRHDAYRQKQRPSYNQEPSRPSYNQEPSRPSYNQGPSRPSYNQGPSRPSYNQEPSRPSYNQEPSRPSYNQGPSPQPPLMNNYNAKPAYQQPVIKPAPLPAPAYQQPVFKPAPVMKPTYQLQKRRFPPVHEYKQPDMIVFDEPTTLPAPISYDPMPMPMPEPCGSPCGTIEPYSGGQFSGGPIITEPIMESPRGIQQSFMANDSRINSMTGEFSVECWKDQYGKEVCVKKFKSHNNTYPSPISQPNLVVEPPIDVVTQVRPSNECPPPRGGYGNQL